MAQDLTALSSTTGYLKNTNGTISLVANPTMSSIVNADISATAEIALWKLATWTNKAGCFIFRNEVNVLTETTIVYNNSLNDLYLQPDNTVVINKPLRFGWASWALTATKDTLFTSLFATTNNTPVPFITLWTSQNYAYFVKVMVLCNDTLSVSSGLWDLIYKVSQGAPGTIPVVVVVSSVSHIDTDLGAVAITDTWSNDTFNLNIVGVVAANLNWKIQITQIYANSA